MGVEVIKNISMQDFSVDDVPNLIRSAVDEINSTHNSFGPYNRESLVKVKGWLETAWQLMVDKEFCETHLQIAWPLTVVYIRLNLPHSIDELIQYLKKHDREGLSESLLSLMKTSQALSNYTSIYKTYHNGSVVYELSNPKAVAQLIALCSEHRYWVLDMRIKEQPVLHGHSIVKGLTEADGAILLELMTNRRGASSQLIIERLNEVLDSVVEAEQFDLRMSRLRTQLRDQFSELIPRDTLFINESERYEWNVPGTFYVVETIDYKSISTSDFLNIGLTPYHVCDLSDMTEMSDFEAFEKFCLAVAVEYGLFVEKEPYSLDQVLQHLTESADDKKILSLSGELIKGLVVCQIHLKHSGEIDKVWGEIEAILKKNKLYNFYERYNYLYRALDESRSPHLLYINGEQFRDVTLDRVYRTIEDAHDREDMLVLDYRVAIRPRIHAAGITWEVTPLQGKLLFALMTTTRPVTKEQIIAYVGESFSFDRMLQNLRQRFEDKYPNHYNTKFLRSPDKKGYRIGLDCEFAVIDRKTYEPYTGIIKPSPIIQFTNI